MKNEKINTGNFTEYITWMAPTAAKDTFGQTKRSFASYKNDFAEVAPVNIDELPVASRMQYAETYSFTTFADTTINSKYQIVYNNENYNIIRIEYFFLKMFMRVTASKIED